MALGGILAAMSAAGSEGHRYFEGMAVSHVLGGLDESEGRVFRSHLLECGDCRARVGELRALASDLADVERDERRQRAAKAVETKRRESDDDDLDGNELPANTRTARVVVLVGLVLLIVLAAWNFTLRNTIAQVQTNAAADEEATATLLTGVPWSVTDEGVDATVRADADGQTLALMIDGMPSNNATADDVVGIYLRNAAGDVVFNLNKEVYNGRLLLSIPLHDAATELVVTNPHGVPGPIPAETHVLRARP